MKQVYKCSFLKEMWEFLRVDHCGIWFFEKEGF